MLDFAYLKINPPGYLYQNSDVKPIALVAAGLHLDIALDYQINKFLKIGNEDCDLELNEPMFNRDECVIKQLLNVNNTKILCTKRRQTVTKFNF